MGGINVSFETSHPEVSYWVRTDLAGQGIATEALAGLCDVLSCIEGYEIIILRCDKANLASQRVADKAGFVFQREARTVKRTEAQSGVEFWYARSGECGKYEAGR